MSFTSKCRLAKSSSRRLSRVWPNTSKKHSETHPRPSTRLSKLHRVKSRYRSRSQGDVLATQMAYWKQHLAGAPALLNFPTDRPRPAAQKFQGETQTLVLSGALAESLKILSRRQGATLFMTLLAALKTLLFRYSGLTDIAGRRHQQHRDHVPRVATAYWRRARAVAGRMERHGSAEGNVAMCSSTL